MLKRLERNDRLELLANHIEQLSPKDFDMNNPFLCFAGHAKRRFASTAHLNSELLHECLGVSRREAHALYRWRVGVLYTTPAQAAEHLRSKIKLKA